jgi:hypothetical protein
VKSELLHLSAYLGKRFAFSEFFPLRLPKTMHVIHSITFNPFRLYSKSIPFPSLNSKKKALFTRQHITYYELTATPKNPNTQSICFPQPHTPTPLFKKANTSSIPFPHSSIFPKSQIRSFPLLFSPPSHFLIPISLKYAIELLLPTLKKS